MTQPPNPDLPKRFYKDVAVVDVAGGRGVELDGRPIKTPERNRLIVPMRLWQMPLPPSGKGRPR